MSFVLNNSMALLNNAFRKSLKTPLLAGQKMLQCIISRRRCSGGRERLATDCRIYEDLNDGYDNIAFLRKVIVSLC